MHQYIPTGGVNQLPEYDPRSGDHYWIVPVVFRVACPAKFADASADPLVLDRENLVYVQSVGCFFCEEPYRNGMEHRRCPGEPR